MYNQAKQPPSRATKFAQYLENHYSLEKNGGYRYTNWIKTEYNLDDEVLETIMNQFMKNPPIATPQWNFLKLRYKTALKGAEPLPTAECQVCFRKYDNNSMSIHAPICSYGVIVIAKLKEEYFKVMSSRDDKVLISEWQAKCDY